MANVRSVGGPLKLKKTGNAATRTASDNPKALVTTSATADTIPETDPTFTASTRIPPSKTPAELAFEAAQKKRQAEKLPQLARKSHKEKVAEYNDYLSKLSEHHDVPKVGPG